MILWRQKWINRTYELKWKRFLWKTRIYFQRWSENVCLMPLGWCQKGEKQMVAMPLGGAPRFHPALERFDDRWRRGSSGLHCWPVTSARLKNWTEQTASGLWKGSVKSLLGNLQCMEHGKSQQSASVCWMCQQPLSLLDVSGHEAFICLSTCSSSRWGRLGHTRAAFKSCFLSAELCW